MDEKIMAILTRMEQKFDNLEKKFDKLEDKVDRIEVQVSENTRILKALQHSAEVNKAEHDKMANDISHIKGDVVGIKNNILQVEEVEAQNRLDIIRLKRTMLV